MFKKQYIYSTLAICGLVLTACSNEEIVPAGNEGQVTFTAQLPGNVNTRAYSDGTGASELKYAVYENGEVVFDNANGPAATYDAATKTFKLSLNLVKGKTYDFAFWAQAANAPYEFNSTDCTVDMNYDADATANNEARDAFFNVEKGLEVNGAIEKNIELRRPFGQLNIGTNDTKEFAAAKSELGNISVEVKDVYNTLNLMTGVAADALDVTFTDVKPVTTTAFPVASEKKDENGAEVPYEYLAMDYILTGTEIGATVNEAQKETKDVNIEIYEVKDGAQALVNEIPVSAVPFQRNYRTNIYGSLLTSAVDYTIVVVPDYFDENNLPQPETAVSTADDLLAAVKTPGANIRLTQDVEITTGPLNLTKDVTIDLGGNTLKTKGSNNGDAIQIQGATVTLKNGKIVEPDNYKSSAGLITVLKNANVTLENMEVTGGIPVYVLSAGSKVDIKSGKYTTTSNSQAVYVQRESKVTIEGGEFSAYWKDETTGKEYVDYVLNLNDKLLADGADPRDFLEVKGGTFHNFDPANSKSENPVANFVAEGYKSVGVDGVYTVTKE